MDDGPGPTDRQQAVNVHDVRAEHALGQQVKVALLVTLVPACAEVGHGAQAMLEEAAEQVEKQ